MTPTDSPRLCEREIMEEGKEALSSTTPGSGRRGRRLSRRYSVNSLRSDFLTRLPVKVHSTVDVESSSPFALPSKSSASLSQGEKDYYEKQFATLKSFEEVDAIVSSEGIDDDDLIEQTQHERAMKISNYANILLLAFKPNTDLCYNRNWRHIMDHGILLLFLTGCLIREIQQD